MESYIMLLSHNKRCIFAVRLAERAAKYLYNSNAKRMIDSAMMLCWNYIDKGENVGEKLYEFLDNEENGFAIIQEMEEDEKNISAWNCIIDAFAYIAKESYLKQGIHYMPEPIMLVEDIVFSHMIQNLILCDSWEEEYIKNILFEVSHDN